EAEVGSLPPEAIQRVLEEVKDRMVGELPDGEVTDESETHLEGRQGIAFKARSSKGEVVQAKAFLGAGRLIIIMVDYRNSPRSQASVDKFFDSLTFNLSAEPSVTAAAPNVPPAAPASVEIPPPPSQAKPAPKGN